MRPIHLFLIIHFLTFSFNLSAQVFSEESQSMGIDHVQFGSKLMGGGIACFDFNSDGWTDIYVTGGLHADKLYKNNGDGTFIDVAPKLGIVKPVDVISMGVTTGDIDNDGIREIFIATDQHRPNLLYKRTNGEEYENVAAEIGLSEVTWSMGAVFTDINQDGFLDLYVINYLTGIAFDLKEGTNEVIGYHPTCLPDYLYQNNGDGTFTNISNKITSGKSGCGLAVTSTDFDDDGDSDIYIANDFGAWSGHPNALLRNDNETLQDVATESGTDAAVYGMGIATGDYNNDLQLDYYVTNLGRNVLYKNQGDGLFEDVATFAMVENTKVIDRFTTGWGALFMDYDNDSYLDLFVANGHIPTIGAPTANTIEDPNKCFQNNKDGTFSEVSDEVGFNHTGRQRGLAFADLDNDGDLDLIAASVTRDDPPSDKLLVYRNNLSSSNNWLKLSLEGSAGNRDAYGAQVYLYAGDDAWLKEISGGSSHSSQNSSILHFGLNSHTGIDSMIIQWPSGHSQHFSKIQSNQLIKIKEQTEIVYDLADCNGSVLDLRIENHREDFEYEVRGKANETLAKAIPGDGEHLSIELTELPNEVTMVCFPKDRSYESRLLLTEFDPRIIRGSGNDLVLPEGETYKWYRNNELLPETSQVYNATVEGIYHGEIINEHGCVFQTESFMLSADHILSVEEESMWRVFPNPYQEFHYIELPNPISWFNYTVFSTSGKLLYQQEYSGITSSTFRIKPPTLNSGIYILSIETEKGSYVQRIRKE